MTVMCEAAENVANMLVCSGFKNDRYYVAVAGMVVATFDAKALADNLILVTKRHIVTAVHDAWTAAERAKRNKDAAAVKAAKGE